MIFLKINIDIIIIRIIKIVKNNDSKKNNKNKSNVNNNADSSYKYLRIKEGKLIGK